MTKLRAPISTEDGITRVAGLLGYGPAAAVIGQKERTLRAYADPDDDRGIKLSDAIRLDCAYRAAGGEDAPILDAYALKLDACVRVANRGAAEMAIRIARLAKESGEGLAALVAANMLMSGPGERAIALRELREWIDAARALVPLLEEEPGMAPP